MTFFALVPLVMLCRLECFFHVFGTTKIGVDVFYMTIKSVRTGVVIGLATTLVTLPIAVSLGLSAGFYGGWVDDLIQYVYTTVSAVPGVLLIVASVLSIQVVAANHPAWFSSLASQADMRLMALCFILGLTGWTGLCRVIRAETLKLREMDYVKAATLLGTSGFRLLFLHILPNVFHLVLIVMVLDFSAAVMAETVLSYIGVGVSPMTMSWGNMINSSRMELAREPIVWWPLAAAILPMFLLVLSANLLADKVRGCFNPRNSGLSL